MSSWRPKISLSLLLLLMIPAAFLSLYMRNRLNNPPIDWKPFTFAKLEKSLESGNEVLVVCKPNYHVGGELTFQTFNDEQIRRSFNENQFKAMLLEYDDWAGTEINAIFERFGHTKHPMAFYFKPNTEPIRLSTYDVDDILDDIPKSELNKRNNLAIPIIIALTFGGAFFWQFRTKTEFTG